MRKSPTTLLPSPETYPRPQNVLNPLVALLAHQDDQAAASFRDVFEDVACDWRLVRVADGTAAARQVMNKGLPQILVVCADLPHVSGSEFVEWMRSFRCANVIPVLVYGESTDPNVREQFLRNEVKLMLPAPCPRALLAARLTEIVSQVEKRRFSMPA